MVSSDHLAPGATGQIKTSVDTAGKSGLLVKHVTVYSNDRSNPVLTLSISMNILQK